MSETKLTPWAIIDIYIDAVLCPSCGNPVIITDIEDECNECKAKFAVKVEMLE